MLFREPRVLSVVLDVSLRHGNNGKRVLDEVKSDLIKHIRKFDEDDLFYLYHEQVVDVAERRGEQVHAVASYQTDGFSFDINYALKQSLYVAGAEDYDVDKAVVLITDRMSKSTVNALNKICMLNEKDGLECEIFVFNVGANFDIEEECDFVLHHCPDKLFEFLQKEFPDGDEDQSEIENLQT